MEAIEETPRQLLSRRVQVALGALHEQRARLDRTLAACRLTVRGVADADSASVPPMRLFAREVLFLGGVEVLVRQQAIRDGRHTRRLTPTEWHLLTFLLSEPGRVHSRAEVAAGAWGSGFSDRRSEVEVYVSRLRRKLGSAGVLLETVRGQGYRLSLEHNLLGVAANGASGGQATAGPPAGTPDS
jgi:DNA-binding response OmpR family regulator